VVRSHGPQVNEAAVARVIAGHSGERERHRAVARSGSRGLMVPKRLDFLPRHRRPHVQLRSSEGGRRRGGRQEAGARMSTPGPTKTNHSNERRDP
jgi:hypothetical protein